VAVQGRRYRADAVRQSAVRHLLIISAHARHTVLLASAICNRSSLPAAAQHIPLFSRPKLQQSPEQLTCLTGMASNPDNVCNRQQARYARVSIVRLT
jgi:hypothetical protein